MQDRAAKQILRGRYHRNHEAGRKIISNRRKADPQRGRRRAGERAPLQTDPVGGLTETPEKYDILRGEARRSRTAATCCKEKTAEKQEDTVAGEKITMIDIYLCEDQAEQLRCLEKWITRYIEQNDPEARLSQPGPARKRLWKTYAPAVRSCFLSTSSWVRPGWTASRWPRK